MTTILKKILEVDPPHIYEAEQFAKQNMFNKSPLEQYEILEHLKEMVRNNFNEFKEKI